MHAIAQDIHVTWWLKISCHFTRSGKVDGVIEIATNFRSTLAPIHSVVMREAEGTYGHHVSNTAHKMVNHPFL